MYAYFFEMVLLLKQHRQVNTFAETHSQEYGYYCDWVGNDTSELGPNHLKRGAFICHS